MSSVEPQADYDLDVVAIHGLTGHPFGTWTYNKRGTNVLWLQDLLPKALPGAKIYTYGYDADLIFSSSIVDIGSCAKALLDGLLLERDTPEVCLMALFRSEIPVAELGDQTCLGGIVYQHISRRRVPIGRGSFSRRAETRS